MRLATRLTFAMGALVIAAVGAVGFLTYRNIAAIAIPRTLARADAHVRILASTLENVVSSARADIMGFRDVIGLEDIIRLTNASAGTSNSISYDEWRSRIARRFEAELRAKPSYAQFRIVGVKDGGREIIRVERSTTDGAVRIVPDDELQRKGDRDYFQQTIAAPDRAVLVSPIELNQERGTIETPHLPVVRISIPIFAPDRTPFGIIVINLDLRPAFKQIVDAGDPDTTLYVANEHGDYLVHPDARREFGFEFHTPIRIQDDFPALAQAMKTGEQQPRLVKDREGTSFAVGLASVRLAAGPRISIIETIPEEKVVAASLSAVRGSTLVGGAIATLCAIALAFLLSRTLTRPLREMTAAVQSFAPGETLTVPVGAGGEIGVLARAFKKMVRDARERTAAIRRDSLTFESLMITMAEAVMLVDQQGRLVYTNKACQRLFGTEVRAGNPDWSNGIEVFGPDGVTPIPLDRRPILRSVGGETLEAFEMYFHTPASENPIHVAGSARPILDATGDVTGAVVVMRDITREKEIERKLHQSQKLDAIGQLTGGVAHDFNNMLTVITGTTRDAGRGPAGPADAAGDRRADRSGGGALRELTQHLLAFARKQPLQPRNVDVNGTVLDIAKLLRPTLGEQIEIDSILEQEVATAHIDPSQLANCAAQPGDQRPRRDAGRRQAHARDRQRRARRGLLRRPIRTCGPAPM